MNLEMQKRRICYGSASFIIGCGLFVVAACVGKVAQSSTGPSESPRSAKEKTAGGIARTPTKLASLDEAHRSPVATGLADERRLTSTTRAGIDPIRIRGRELYAKYCAICHGEEGDGAGKFAYLMNPRPRDFRKGDFKLATTRNQVPSNDDLLRTISRGMPGSAMPPWGHLPNTDLQALVEYVRQFHVNATTELLNEWVAEGLISEAEVPEVLTERTVPGRPLSVPPEPAFDEIRWFQ